MQIAGVVVGASTTSPPPPKNPELDNHSAKAVALYTAGRYLNAASEFEAGAKAAAAAGESLRAAKFWNGVGGSLHAAGQYRAALSSYNQALQLAKKLKSSELIGALSVNIASMYLFLWEPDAAEMAAREAAQVLPQDSEYQPQLFFTLASVRARLRDFKEARRLAVRGIELAAEGNKPQTEIMGWEKLGWFLLSSELTDGAEEAFSEAFRLSRMNRIPVSPPIYQGLARVRMAQRRPKDAIALLDVALSSGVRASARVPLWLLYQARGRAYEMAGDPEAALADYRLATRVARLWRQDVLPASWVQTAVDMGVSNVSSDFIELACRKAGSGSGNPLSMEAFLEAEESKAASLRAVLLSGSQLPPELRGSYLETVQKLRGAILASLARGSAAESQEVTRYRAELARLESQAEGGRFPAPLDTSASPAARLRIVQSRLKPSEALISFHMGELDTRVWVVTRERFYSSFAPGRPALQPLIEAETKSLIARTESMSGGSWSDLSSSLLSGLPAEVFAKTDWLLSLDETLFGVPWAALRQPGSQVGRYLVENHSLEVLPSALLLLRRAAGPFPAGRFLAVGDAIYNRADSRWTGERRQTPGSGYLKAAFAKSEGATPVSLEMPRLVGSAREIEASAEALGVAPGQRELLTGSQALASRLQSELAKRTGVLHFATHIMISPQSRGSFLVSPEIESPRAAKGFSAQKPSEILIALSLDSGGNLNFLSASEILSSTYQLSNALVVLNGCSSGKAEVWPGAGLLGMSRAWMTTGARAVVVSHWPAPDDSGVFFEGFYSALRKNSGSATFSTAQALRSAQLEAIHSGGWRAQPKVWASYFLVGRE